MPLLRRITAPLASPISLPNWWRRPWLQACHRDWLRGLRRTNVRSLRTTAYMIISCWFSGRHANLHWLKEPCVVLQLDVHSAPYPGHCSLGALSGRVWTLLPRVGFHCPFHGQHTGVFDWRIGAAGVAQQGAVIGGSALPHAVCIEPAMEVHILQCLAPWALTSSC